MNYVVALLVFLSSGIALAFPENIRHGYPSCTSCHVSPVGGGALTPYGRGISEAMQSTWARDGEGDRLYGLVPLPKWLLVGGDQRGVGIAARTPAGVQTRAIPMQRDVEVAVQVPSLPGITIDASVGAYGPESVVEYRRTYVKADLSPVVSLRAGRFMPAYGVNLPDHTTITREEMGLGEGAESYNAEVAWVVPGGEAVATFIYGDSVVMMANSRDGFDSKQGEEMSGAAWRSALYLGNQTQVGVSYLGVSNFHSWRQGYGAFVQSGIMTRAYVLAEYDRKFEDGAAHDLGMVKLGYELHQGVMATVQEDCFDMNRESRVGLQWFPRPHWELLVEARRSFEGPVYQDSAVLLLHHYL